MFPYLATPRNHVLGSPCNLSAA